MDATDRAAGEDDVNMYDLADLLVDDIHDDPDQYVPRHYSDNASLREAALASDEDDDGEQVDNTRELADRAMKLPGGPELVGRLLQLPELPAYVNVRQRHRILARRHTKIRLQAARVLRGYTEGGHVRDARIPLP